MAETPLSLLQRISRRNHPGDWRELIDLYEPLLRGWLARQQIPGTETSDLVQEILSVLVEKLPRFEHSGRPGSFRTWLRRIVVYQVRYFWRQRQRQTIGDGRDETEELLQQLEDPGSNLSTQWDRDHDHHVMRHLLARIRQEFTPGTWALFEQSALQGLSPEKVAAKYGTTVNAVFIARSRVLRRLREEAVGLLDGDDTAK